jgi:hypothetical protein
MIFVPKLGPSDGGMRRQLSICAPVPCAIVGSVILNFRRAWESAIVQKGIER